MIDGKSGYLVGSDHELFLRLGDLLADPERRRRFGEAGRRHSESFDWDHVTRRWEEVFGELLAQKAARAA